MKVTSRGRASIRFGAACALLGLALISSACADPGPGTPGVENGDAVGEAPAADGRTFSVDDLERVVIGPGEAPDGTEHSYAAEGEEVLEMLTAGMESEEAARAGFQGGRASLYTGTEDSSMIAAWGVLYEDPGAAAAAMDTIVEEMAADPGMSGPDPITPALGEESVSVRGAPSDAPAGGAEEINYIWRTGNLLLAVSGIAYEESGIRAIAQTMAERAR